MSLSSSVGKWCMGTVSGGSGGFTEPTTSEMKTDSTVYYNSGNPDGVSCSDGWYTKFIAYSTATASACS